MVTAEAFSGPTFRGKDAEEEVVIFFRQHWIRIATRMLRIVLQTLFLFAIGWVTFVSMDIAHDATARAIGLLLTFAFLATQFEFLVVFYRYFLRITIFTDRKVHLIKKTLLLIDDHRSIDLWMLQDIQKFQRGPIQNLFGFGSIVIDAQESQLRLHFVPDAQKKVQVLLGLRERAREQIHGMRP